MKRIMSLFARFALLFSRSHFAGAFAGWGFAHTAALLPLDRLYETERVVAFRHPRPAHPVHILIVPKQAIPHLLALGEADIPILWDVLRAVQHLVRALRLEAGYRLVANGGQYQDVRQLHFHLVSDVESVDPGGSQ